ncbi:LytR/AlgR family response regulator transcription factor [Sphingobacterium sp. LRF_L2]|uniref:LytR/AlgR family response regulator transcription factor n=1 Tax=Sphingobacterium sp. LRF_L2 TaxID=3369421 RepID=UPI003F6194AC
MEKKNVIKVGLVDDDVTTLEILKGLLSVYNDLEVVLMESNSKQALSSLKKHKVDLLFCDIKMPFIDGISLVRVLPYRPKIIMMTAFVEESIHVFDLDVADCIDKPIQLVRLDRAIKRAKGEERKMPVLGYTMVKEMDTLLNVKIYFDDLLYMESKSNNIRFVLVSGQIVVSRMTITELLRRLPLDKFMQVHKGYVINLEKVFKLNPKKRKVLFSGFADEIAISKTYFDEFLRRFDAFNQLDNDAESI